MLIGFFFHLFIIFEIAPSAASGSKLINKNQKHELQDIGACIAMTLETMKLLGIGSPENENKRDQSRDMVSLPGHESTSKTADPKGMTTAFLGFIMSVQEKSGSLFDKSHDTFPAKQSKILESSIPADVKDDPLLESIFTALSLMPLPLIKIMYEYIVYDELIKECFNRIAKKMKDLTKEKITFNLYASNFILDLSKLIYDKSEAIPLDHQFWYDLKRFLFKYALSMNERFANADNDSAFLESVEDIVYIMALIDKKNGSSKLGGYIKPSIPFNFFIFKYLLIYEMFDHPQLFELFAKKMIDEKANLIMTLKEIEEGYCDGNIDKNNPVLKMMLINLAFGPLATDQMIKKGWLTEEDTQFRKSEESRSSRELAITLHNIYSKREKEEGDRFEQIESSCSSKYLSQSTIRFFIDHNLGFRISMITEVLRFIRILEYLGGLPKGVPMSKIVKIGFPNACKWDAILFEGSLAWERHFNKVNGKASISQEEYDEYLKLAE